MLLSTAAAFAQNDDTNPLTGQVDTFVDSAEAVKLRSSSGDPAAGKEKSILCQGCHGTDGISFEPLVPSLGGQYARYITKQIRNYQAGTRSHQIMNAMVGTIANETDQADIAAYFASQTKMKGAGAENETGKNLFLHGDISRTVVGCINCHGVRGKGLTPNTSLFPVIGGQNKEYVRRQLTLFRDGYRTNSPSGVMNKIAQKLTDAEIEALAEYASAQ
ncbi:MAG: cytochrome c4 [Nitrosomonadales bacterium]|nr:cytochrome c4 [Nitrosomonadales bacterium]